MALQFNPREISADRLTTSDAQGRRVYLYPAEVKGKYRKRRTRLHAAFILILLVFPWIKYNGTQVLLLDVVHRRFTFFGVTLLAHDVPMVVLVALAIVFFIAFITILWGRLWCGWACPQTVFVDTVFRTIERWIEGDAIQRRLLDQSGLSLRKIFLKGGKWFCFLIATLVITHSFLAYFVGAEALAHFMAQSPAEHASAFIFILTLSGWLLFDLGWFREQFCTVVCPYARFQSVLMEPQTLSITYDSRRGEPRKGSVQGSGRQGDCVNCYRCIQVCPTGIDIRNGLQLECIACTACVDACDDVMERLQRPHGLIGYARAVQPVGKKFRLRPALYFLAFFFCGIGFLGLCLDRNPWTAIIVRAPEIPYQLVRNSVGEDVVINHFKVKVRNQSLNDRTFSLALGKPDEAIGLQLITATATVPLEAGSTRIVDFFLKVPKAKYLKGRTLAHIKVEEPKTGMKKEEELHLVGPDY